MILARQTLPNINHRAESAKGACMNVQAPEQEDAHDSNLLRLVQVQLPHNR